MDFLYLNLRKYGHLHLRHLAQIDLTVILTIFDFFSSYYVVGRPKKYRTQSFKFSEIFFTVNIT